MGVQVLSYEVPGWGVGELYLDGERLLYHELPSARETRAERLEHPLAERLQRYFAGERATFADVDLDLSWGTEFQVAVANALRAVPYGEMVTYGERPESGSQRDRVRGIDLRSLSAGTAVVVDTRHSRYRVVMLDGSGWNALVQGGPYFPQQTTARVEGSTLGGSLLKSGWIGVGWFMELSCGGERIITSQVRSISVPKGRHDEHSSRT